MELAETAGSQKRKVVGIFADQDMRDGRLGRNACESALRADSQNAALDEARRCGA
jgi:hypothetical protein